MLADLGFAVSPAAATTTSAAAADANSLTLAILRQNAKASVDTANVRRPAAGAALLVQLAAAVFPGAVRILLLLLVYVPYFKATVFTAAVSL